MEKKNTVNLHLASIWEKNLKDGAEILERKILEKTDGRKIKITYRNYLEKVKGETVGFSWKTFIEYGLGEICIEGEFIDRFVKIVFAHWGPKKDGLFVFKGYTKGAVVFFGGANKSTKDDEYFVDLQEFPSDEFCQICVKWVFEGVRPIASLNLPIEGKIGQGKTTLCQKIPAK